MLGLLLLRPALQIFQLATPTLIALPAFVGHAGATPGIGGDVHLIGDMMHLLAAVAWLGGLPGFVVVALANAPGRQTCLVDFAIRATRRFSLGRNF